MSLATGVGVGAPFVRRRPNVAGLTFDGSDDRVTIADDDALDITGAFTLELWVRAVTWAGTPSLVGKREVGNSNSNYQLTVLSTTSVLFFVQGDSSTWTISALNTAQWYHFAVTHPGGGAAKATLYIDGVSQGLASANTTLTANTGPLHFGNSPGRTEWLSGDLDELRLWTEVRTAAQVDVGRFEHVDRAPNLVGSWSMDTLEVIAGGAIIGNILPTIGATPSHRVADNSGNDNHGTYDSFPNDPHVQPPNLGW